MAAPAPENAGNRSAEGKLRALELLLDWEKLGEHWKEWCWCWSFLLLQPFVCY